MGYRLRVVPEVEVWLLLLRDIDPVAADLVDDTLNTLREAGAGLGGSAAGRRHRTRLAARLVRRDNHLLPYPL